MDSGARKIIDVGSIGIFVEIRGEKFSFWNLTTLVEITFASFLFFFFRGADLFLFQFSFSVFRNVNRKIFLLNRPAIMFSVHRVENWDFERCFFPRMIEKNFIVSNSCIIGKFCIIVD